jgi:hypothetical protein
MSDELWYGDIAAWTGFSITSTSADSAYPLTRVTDRYPGLVFRTATNGNQYITLNGSTSVNVIGCVLVNINLTSADTIQAQYSNDNFSSTLGTQNFTVKSYLRRKWDPDLKKSVSYTRYDAYAAHSWSLQDFRILMNSGTLAQYEVGKILLLTDRYIFEKGTRNDYPGGWEIRSKVIESESGHLTSENNYIRHNFGLKLPYTSKNQADSMAFAALEPYCIYFVDGLTGEMLFGKLDISTPEVRQKYGSGKRMFSGNFVEII